MGVFGFGGVFFRSAVRRLGLGGGGGNYGTRRHGHGCRAESRRARCGRASRLPPVGGAGSGVYSQQPLRAGTAAPRGRGADPRRAGAGPGAGRRRSAPRQPPHLRAPARAVGEGGRDGRTGHKGRPWGCRDAPPPPPAGRQPPAARARARARSAARLPAYAGAAGSAGAAAGARAASRSLRRGLRRLWRGAARVRARGRGGAGGGGEGLVRAGARPCVRAPRADNWRGFPEGGKCHLIHSELFKSPHPRADTHTHIRRPPTADS